MLQWEVGTPVSTLAGLRDGEGPSGLGRMGCFATTRGARRWADSLFVTNHHVLAAYGGRPGDAVFAPDLADEGDTELRIDQASLRPIAEIADGGYDGVHEFAYPGEPVAGFHVDCGSARLAEKDTQPAGRVGFEVGRAHGLDALPHRPLSVRMLGVHDRPAGQEYTRRMER